MRQVISTSTLSESFQNYLDTDIDWNTETRRFNHEWSVNPSILSTVTAWTTLLATLKVVPRPYGEVEVEVPSNSSTMILQGMGAPALPLKAAAVWTIALPATWCLTGDNMLCTFTLRLAMDAYWANGSFTKPTLKTLDLNGFEKVKVVKWLEPSIVSRRWEWAVVLEAVSGITSQIPVPHLVFTFEWQVVGDKPARGVAYGFDVIGLAFVSASLLSVTLVKISSESEDLCFRSSLLSETSSTTSTFEVIGD